MISPGQTDTRNNEAAVLIPDRHVVIVTLLGQAMLTALLALLLAIWKGQTAAVSLLLGGMIAVVPNAFLGARLLTPGAGGSAKALLRSAWLGEIGKLVLTAVLFGIVFARVRPLSGLAVFGGFIAAQLVIFGALFLGDSSVSDNEATKN